MSVISKDLAGQIAYKMTEKSRLAAEKLHVEFRELTTSQYEETIPEEVLKCFKKHPDWFETVESVSIHGNGFNHEYVSTTRQVITQLGRSSPIFQPISKIADKLTTAIRKWQKAKKEYENLKSESKQALLTLKTFSNIRKEIPLAAPMLPPPMSNALVVNFESLKKRLEKQPNVVLNDNRSVATEA